MPCGSDDLLDDVRLHQDPAVAHGGQGHGQLQRRDRHPLAEGHGDPVDEGAGLAEISQQPAALSRETDAAFAAKAKLPEILIQAGAAQLVGDLGRADIARFLDDLLYRQAPVRMHIVDHFLGIQLPDGRFHN